MLLGASLLPILIFGLFAIAPSFSDDDVAEDETPDIEDPDMGDPDAEDPDAEDPDAEDPDAEDPDAEDPDAEDPDAEDPDAEDPDEGDTDFVTVAVAGEAASGVTPVEDEDGALSVTGTEADEEFAIDPTVTTPLSLDPGAGTDVVDAGLFHDVVTKGDEAVDTLNYTIAAAELAAENAETPIENGFVTEMDPTDTLTVTLADDITGTLHAVQVENFSNNTGSQDENTDFAVNIYILPEGGEAPPAEFEGDEATYMETYGLTKIGTIELGNFTNVFDPETEELTEVNNTVQEEPPTILGDREISTSAATFV